MIPGDIVAGPSIVIESHGTNIVEPGWQARLTARGHLMLDRVIEVDRAVDIRTTVDPVMLEIFNNMFMSIAEQMGTALTNTAYSVNIKERRDFSCALFDPDGQLVANAPHQPVHLGSMGESIAAIIRSRRLTMKPGQVYMLNAPYNGGTHLPDVTVVRPVFDAVGKEVIFYVGARAHHADIGGLTPGSVPPNSQVVEEEGVLIDNFLVVEEGILRERETRKLFASGDYPSRNVDQNIGDLTAQIAACEKGVQELQNMTRHYGLDVVQAYMGHVQDNAEELVRKVLSTLRGGNFTYPLDSGAEIRVRIEVDHATRSATIDFTGTSPQQANNFNAPTAVCKAAVLYVFRTLVDEDIPLNGGCLKPLNIIVPEGSMLAPHYPAAVVAGNVETSQYITDTLFGALGVMAASQGTMNNITFGDENWQYYETNAGGAGAGPDFDGASVVQTHMTNGRLADPEVHELRFPVLIECLRIRRGSGGNGRYVGGDGSHRRLRFLRDMTAAIVSCHRKVPPYGMAGGEPGEVGRTWVERSVGDIVELKSSDQIEMYSGDVLVLDTPSGGGYGPPGERLV
jgi:5-oxoprolinase (ATP-hydrolysing)